MVAGIYKITNLVNNRFYIGQALDFDDRWKLHRTELKGDYHHNKYLQNDWNKCGSECFAFEIVVICDVYNLDFYEQRFVDYYWDDCNQCYNWNRFIHNPMKGKKHTDEAIEKIRTSQKGRKKPPRNKQARLNMSIAKLGKPNVKKRKSVIAFELKNNNFERQFESINLAAEHYELDRRQITHVLVGRVTTAKKKTLSFKYA